MIAGGLNRVDLYMRNTGAGITHQLPLILGLDGAGVVEEADEGSTVRASDEVVIYPGQPCGTCESAEGRRGPVHARRIFGEQVDGTFAGFVSAPEGSFLGKPRSLDFVQGASLSVAWLTAWRMVRTKARLEPGETALIFGVGGSVSLAATQIVGAMGARAIVTSRDPAKLDRVAAFGLLDDLRRGRLLGARPGDGAHRQTRRRRRDRERRQGGLADGDAGAGARRPARHLRRDDRRRPVADLRRLFIRQLTVFGSTLGTRAEFADMIAFITEKGLTPHIDQTFPLTEIHAAMDRLEAGRQLGKIGLVIGAGEL